MKIALIGPVYPYRGGVAHYTALLDQALRQQTHTVCLISFCRQYPRWLFPGTSDRDPSATGPASLEANYWIDSLNPLSWLYAFRRIVQFQPDIFVLQWWTTYWAPVWLTLAWLNRVTKRWPITFICHNVLPHDPTQFDRWLTQLVLRHGQQFIVQSEAARDELRGLLGNVPIAHVPHPVMHLFSENTINREGAKVELGVTERFPVLLFFGFVRKYKNLCLLLDALPHIIAELPDAHLVIAGEFWGDKADYLRQIASLKLQSYVTIHDEYIPNEKVVRYFLAADLMVAPYPHAGNSSATQVAAGFALPVLPRLATSADLDALDARRLAQEIVDHVRSPEDESPGNSATTRWEDLASTLTHPGSTSATTLLAVHRPAQVSCLRLTESSRQSDPDAPLITVIAPNLNSSPGRCHPGRFAATEPIGWDI